MYDRPERPSAAISPEPWLEVIEGNRPLLLIAPHGGRAGAAARALLHPKVNDLFTAGITRTLAARLGAGALINTAMDRNRLDCNRLRQLNEHAPWMLEMIAAQLDGMVARDGRAIVLVIHGWNIIEPRLDFGLGARLREGKLVPAGSAHISASDEFVNGPVARLVDLLGRDGIIASFGHRYPAGGIQNLLQAFTPRHIESPHPALSRIAALSASGAIDAVQLELSVAVRMPGAIRERALDSISAVFSGDGHRAHRDSTAIPVVRTVKRKTPSAPAAKAPIGIPARVGIEFFDPAARVGGMASFDLGAGGAGARIMVLLDRRRVALFTSEGKPHRDGNRIVLGPLALEADDDAVTLSFRGPAVIVPDGAAYLSIERALASGALDEAVEVSVRLELDGGANDLREALADTASIVKPPEWLASFGRLTGTIAAAGARHALDAVGRAGLSFTGIGAARFGWRRMLWACFPESPMHAAIEARATADHDGVARRTGRVLSGSRWAPCEVAQLDLDTPAIDAPPGTIAATLAVDGATHVIVGEVENFIPLSRPGPDQSRIYTSLGFANFRIGPHRGAGMFEYSRRAATRQIATLSEDKDESD